MATMVLNIFAAPEAAADAPATAMPAAAIPAPMPFASVFVAEGEKEINVSDSVFYKIASTVIFPVNKYDIPKNSPFIQKLENEILPVMNQEGMHLEKVIMRGAASPEGPLSWNTTLGRRRVEALFNFINARTKLPADKGALEQIDEPEDYQYLVKMMHDANDKDANFVDSLVKKYYRTDIAKLKRELQVAQGRQLWRRLLKEYFPQLRAARVVLVFRKYAKKYDLEDPSGLAINLTAPSLKQPDITVGIEKSKVEQPGTKKVDTFEWIEPRREMLSVKTNLLLDGMYMPSGYDRWCPIPNVAVEYYPRHGHFTYGASFDCPWWQDYDAHKYFQVRNYQLETRYYLRSGDIKKNPPGEGAAFRGWYAQAYANMALYAIMFTEHRGWYGEGVGGGVGLGYVMPISKDGHWRLEFGAQFGLFYTQYDPFQYECPVDPTEHDNLYYYKWKLDASLFKERQYRFSWLGPTRIGITVSYDLLYWKNKKQPGKKRKVSFLKWEKGGALW